MHLRHERTGRVDRLQPPRGRGVVNRRRDAVRREDEPRALGHARLALDEDRAALLEVADDVHVVDDLLAHVDGRPVQLQRSLDGLDRPLDACAESARRGEQHALHHGR